MIALGAWICSSQQGKFSNHTSQKMFIFMLDGVSMAKQQLYVERTVSLRSKFESFRWNQKPNNNISVILP
jgi:hypothetical protein